jgi:hypothetical protein
MINKSNTENIHQTKMTMRTMKLFRMGAMILVLTGLFLTGCKKEKNNGNSEDSSSMQQLAMDEISEQAASDESMNDVSNLLSGGTLKSTDIIPCGATVDSTNIINDTITIYITYNGYNCNGTRSRTGQVEIRKHVGMRWFQAGATVNVRHINFTITRVLTGKSITLNSNKTFQNVSGGIIPLLGHGITSIVHRLWGTETVTFPNSTSRNWNVARQITFTGTPGRLLITIDGFGSAGEYNNLVVWGVNRNGENFYTQIMQSVVHRQVCDLDPVSGIKLHQIPSDSKSATITYGYDRNNQPITGDECPAKFRVDWQKNGNSGTVYLWLP